MIAYLTNLHDLSTINSIACYIQTIVDSKQCSLNLLELTILRGAVVCARTSLQLIIDFDLAE